MPTTQPVATNVCGDLPVTMPINIDCSLCLIGFPQAFGMIGISFYGPACTSGADPSPSYWLGLEQKVAQWMCFDPGPNAEPSPNTWSATGFFSGIASGGCSNQYRFDAVLTVTGANAIAISVSVKVLAATTGGNSWQSYLSWSESLTELSNPDHTRYRSRNFASPGFVSVTPALVGGKGDPVSFVKTVVGMTSMKIGCGSLGGSWPVCGFWDGTQWLTCLRAVVKTSSTYNIREFRQLGFNTSGCGGVSSGGYCGCDTITLTSLSPITGTTTSNSDPQFVTDYGVLGLPGGIEAVGAVQQIQIGGSSASGVNLAVKQVSNGQIYICTNDNGAGWICTAATVSQANSPRILTANPAGSGLSVYLYALNFPNSEILSAECGNGGAYPTPSAGDPWWCTATGCVQSPLQPTDALGGPYATLGLCVAGCPQNTGEYWCLYGYCVQSETQPAGSTGPYLTSGACTSACGEVIMVYHCGDSGCSLIPKGEAITLGYTYWDTLAECEASCVARWFCRPEGCATSHLNPPPDAFLGPFASEAECLASACASNTGAGYYCIGGDTMVCGYYTARPYNAIGPKYLTNMACAMACHPSLGAMEGTESQDGQIVAKQAGSLVDRLKLPCVHRGDLIGTKTMGCGCGARTVYHCNRFNSECTQILAADSGGVRSCSMCPDYSR